MFNADNIYEGDKSQFDSLINVSDELLRLAEHRRRLAIWLSAIYLA
jgi:hypothetical protein